MELTLNVPARQMTLPFTHPARAPLDDLVQAPSNAAARHWLAHPADWPAGRLVLCAEPGIGKTLLAHRWASPNGLILIGAALPAFPDLPSRIAIDDADTRTDERALLHLLNAAAEANCYLLLTARAAPARWPTTLPDLASRLRATQLATIDPPEDELLRALLARHLAARQLAVPEPVQDWLLLRLPRTPRAMADVAARLDAASLTHQRPITLPLARDTLAGVLSKEPPTIDEDAPPPAPDTL